MFVWYIGREAETVSLEWLLSARLRTVGVPWAGESVFRYIMEAKLSIKCHEK